MRFPYSKVAEYRRHSEEPALVIYEPIVPIEVIGPTGEIQFDALVDTGSQITVLPSVSSSSRHLTGRKANLRAIDGKIRRVFEGKDTKLKLILDGVAYEWPCDVWFAKDHNTRPTLGMNGFLEYFIATFDGKEKSVTLRPHTGFPGTVTKLW